MVAAVACYEMKVFGVVVVVVINAKRFIEYCAREEQRKLRQRECSVVHHLAPPGPIIAPDKRLRRNISKVLKLKSDGLRVRALFSVLQNYIQSSGAASFLFATQTPHRHFPVIPTRLRRIYLLAFSLAHTKAIPQYVGSVVGEFHLHLFTQGRVK